MTARRSPSPRAIIAVLAFAGLTASMMQTILIPLQAELPSLLHASRDETAWVITITLLVSAVVTPIAGRLGDMFGKRRIAIILLCSLMAGCVLGAFATDVVQLIAARGLQGTGMGLIPLGVSILRDMLPLERIGSGVALISASMGFGGAIGLPVSAIVAQFLDYHWLFWMVTAIALVALVLYAVVIPPSPQRSPGRVDVLGAVGLAAALTGILLAVSKGNSWGWLSAPTLVSLIAGLGILALWGVYQVRGRNPLVDLRLTARKPVLLTNASSLAMGFALYSSSIVFPQVLTVSSQAGGLGLSLFAAGLLLTPTGLTMMLMSPVSGRAQARFGARRTLLLGAAILALTYAVCAIVPLNGFGVAVASLAIGVGSGFGYSSMPTLTMQAVPLAQTGVANGINTLMRALGTAFSAAAIGAVLAHTTVLVGGQPAPTHQGFQIAFLFGFGAASLSAVVALFIPARQVTAPGLHAVAGVKGVEGVDVPESLSPEIAEG